MRHLLSISISMDQKLAIIQMPIIRQYPMYEMPVISVNRMTGAATTQKATLMISDYTLCCG